METYYRFVDTTTAWQIKGFIDDLTKIEGGGFIYVYPSDNHNALMVATKRTVPQELEQKWEKFVKRVA